MGFYLYCVVPPDHAPPAELDGLERAGVELLEGGAVAAWHSMLVDRPRPSLPRIRHHDRIVRAAHTEAVTPLPARFGQWFPDAAALATRLSAPSTDYERALGHVAGAAEFGVVLLSSHPSTGSKPDPAGGGANSGTTAGRAYLHALAERENRDRHARRQAERLLAELEAAVGSRVRDARPTTGDSERDRLASVAHLVAHEAADEYAAAVRRFEARHRDLEIVLTGPVPPYSFAP